MNSFEKLFVNSTNRFSAVKNIILSQAASSFTPLQTDEYKNQIIQKENSFLFASPIQNQSNETFEQLQQKFDQLSKVVKQAHHEKQIMSILLNKILKVQQGEEKKLHKRFRRKKNQLQSKFQCNNLNCNKIYSSSASLARHTKLKHAYCTSQPPQHNYQIPPSPNLNQSEKVSNGAQPQSISVESEQQNDEEGAANQFENQKDFYEADWEDSLEASEQIEDI